MAAVPTATNVSALTCTPTKPITLIFSENRACWQNLGTLLKLRIHWTKPSRLVIDSVALTHIIDAVSTAAHKREFPLCNFHHSQKEKENKQASIAFSRWLHSIDASTDRLQLFQLTSFKKHFKMLAKTFPLFCRNFQQNGAITDTAHISKDCSRKVAPWDWSRVQFAHTALWHIYADATAWCCVSSRDYRWWLAQYWLTNTCTLPPSAPCNT